MTACPFSTKPPHVRVAHGCYRCPPPVARPPCPRPVACPRVRRLGLRRAALLTSAALVAALASTAAYSHVEGSERAGVPAATGPPGTARAASLAPPVGDPATAEA